MVVGVKDADITEEERNKILERVARIAGRMIVEMQIKELAKKDQKYKETEVV